MTYGPTNVGYTVTLDACEVVGDLPLSGEGVIDDLAGTFTMRVTAPGGTDVDYQRDADDAVTVTGTWFGDAVDVEG